jgi:heme/copper-type cytochrome/quinol oxidase subunit 2
VALLAQMHPSDGGGSLILSIIALVAMIIPFIVLGYVCWIFWKAKRREEAAERRASEWRNAHSS